jgi:hypothetical protein
MIEVNIDPKDGEISIQSAKIVYIQKDGDNPNNMQELEISTNDLGAGLFFEFKSKKWSFDSLGELTDIVQDFKQKLNLKENAPNKTKI